MQHEIPRCSMTASHERIIALQQQRRVGRAIPGVPEGALIRRRPREESPESPMAEIAWFDTPQIRGCAAQRPPLVPSAPRPKPRPPRAADDVRHHRTIFISDTHLGTRGCKAELLADFLAHNDCDTLYLVGDIVDGWRLKRRWYWPEAHSRVVDANPAQGG